MSRPHDPAAALSSARRGLVFPGRDAPGNVCACLLNWVYLPERASREPHGLTDSRQQRKGRRVKTERWTRRWGLCSAVLALLAAGSGCGHGNWGWWNWFDPSRNIKEPEQPTMSLILEQIGPADETEELVPNATFPTAEDLIYSERDYVIGPTDILRISILDLFQEGVEALLERQVSNSGHILLPYNVRIKASGLTAEQLTEAIKDALDRANVLRKAIATISVSVVGPRQNIFSVLGAIARPGTYTLPRPDFTLLEALALAGDVNQLNIEWVYVIRPTRKAPGEAAAPLPAGEELPPLPTLPTTTRPAPTLEQQLKELEQFIPGARLERRGLGRPGEVGEERVLLSSVGSGPAGADQAAPAPEPPKPKWIYSGGQWIRQPETPAETAEAAPAVPAFPVKPAPQAELREEDPFGWKQYDMSGLARIIAVNLPRLADADPKLNIIIRENDIIRVPPLRLGEFYVMGEVLRPGVYNLTGRQVTAKQAVAAAGNLGVLSWPNNSILIRRVGRDQEQVIRLPLNDIFLGRENDVFLKPNDVIAVGSHWSAPFLAVWRNAFRMTYGFGFIYDRNYSERDFEVPILWPRPGLRPFTSD